MKEEGKFNDSDDDFLAIIEIGFDEAVISKAVVGLRGIYALSCHPVLNSPFQMPAFGQLQKRFALICSHGRS